MHRFFKILVLPLLLVITFICGGQTYGNRKFTLSKSISMPGLSAWEIRQKCVREWGLESLGFYDLSHPGVFDGLSCAFDTLGVPVGGKPVDLRGRVVFAFRDGGFDLEYTFILATWNNGRKAVTLPPLDEDPGYYISHFSKSNKRMLALIYAKAGDVFNDLTEYFEDCAGRSALLELEGGDIAETANEEDGRIK